MNDTVATRQGPRNARTAFAHRWWIEYELVAKTPLSIGDGTVNSQRIRAEKDDGEPPEVNAVALNAAGRPYIPATGLKGALRAFAQTTQMGAALEGQRARLVADLFGDNTKGKDGNLIRKPGFVDFHDAHFIAPRDDEQQNASALASKKQHLAHYSSSNDSFVETSTRIDRDRGTVADRALFNDERVCTGATFKGSFFIQHHDEASGKAIVADLLGLLNTAAEQGGLALGADTRRGYGCVKFSGVSVKYFGKKQLATWQEGGFTGTWKNAAQTVKDLVPSKFAGGTKATALTLEIAFSGLYLVNEPSRATKGEGGVAHTPRLDEKGQPVLPARTLQGALRNQSERILRTLGVHCCGAGGEASCDNKKDDAAQCLICELYGNTRQASRLTQPTAPKCTFGGSSHTQDFIAIDRFTGGGKDGAKFNAVSRYQPRFEVTLSVADGVSEAARGLILLTLRDLAEGDIPLGWGKRKGYGACTVVSSPGEPFIERAAIEITGNREANSALAALRALPRQHSRTSSIPADVEALFSAATASGGATANTSTNTNASASVAKPANGRRAASAAPANAGGIPDRFHNTYHFIPIEAADLPKWATVDNFRDKKKWATEEGIGVHSHARYASGTEAAPVFSGRIQCTLTAETPFIVGGRRPKNDDGTTPTPVVVLPYMLDDEYALPATSIKGMVGAIAEAASGSAMRVFDGKRVLSYRKPMNGALSWLGRVVLVKQEASEKLLMRIQPLCLPHIQTTLDRVLRLEKGENWSSSRPQPGPTESEQIGKKAEVLPLKVYIGEYDPPNKPIRDASGFLTRTTASYTDQDPDRFYWMKLPDDFSVNAKGPPPKGAMVDPSRTIVSQRAQPERQVPLTKTQFDALPDATKSQYTRGIIRVLGRLGSNRESIPQQKKHELFIPFPEGCEDVCNEEMNPVLYPISRRAKERFESLARERNDAQPYLPFAPQETRPNGQGVVDIREGDIVFYALDQAKTQVVEISYSMIWRGQVEWRDDKAASLGDFVAFQTPADQSAARRNLLPFALSRSELTPAELLLGFVQEDGDESQEGAQSLAFAGKLRFSDALQNTYDNAVTTKPVTLKILSAPKVNASLYFAPRGDPTGYVAKANLRPDLHKPLGRKFYSHALSDQNEASHLRNVKSLNKAGEVATPSAAGNPPWVSFNDDNLDQKAKLTPLDSGAKFNFTVDFDNLSMRELELLCFALRPFPSFRHKLGLGKAIGLGTVRVDPIQLNFIDRLSRYGSHALSQARYTGAPLESGRIAISASRFAKSAPDQSVIGALRTVGDPDKVLYPVHVPTRRTATDAENETFTWFVHNDDTSKAGPTERQALGAIVRDELPFLQRN